MELAQDAALPSPRDFACMVDLPGGRLMLLFGGLDASEKRLDDTWIFDSLTCAAISSVHNTLTMLGLFLVPLGCGGGHACAPCGMQVHMGGGEGGAAPAQGALRALARAHGQPRVPLRRGEQHGCAQCRQCFSSATWELCAQNAQQCHLNMLPG